MKLKGHLATNGIITVKVAKPILYAEQYGFPPSNPFAKSVWSKTQSLRSLLSTIVTNQSTALSIGAKIWTCHAEF
jgi:hypothetical protein